MNQWVLGWLFSSDGRIETFQSKVIIAFFDVVFISTGLIYLIILSAKVNKNLKAVLFGISICIVLYLAIEITCYYVNQWGGAIWIEEGFDINGNSVPAVLLDPLLGYKPKSDTRIVHTKAVGAKLIYKAIYQIDSMGRRNTPSKNGSKSILFFGCSFIYGEGLSDNETIPYFTGECAPDYIPYNYGFRGYGPQHMLARLQDANITKEVKNTDVIIVVYNFVGSYKANSHIHRAIISRTSYQWLSGSPYYSLTANGLVRCSFRESNPVKSFIYEVLQCSELMKLLRVEMPFRIGMEHIEVTSKIIEESNGLLKSLFKNCRFVVVCYPIPPGDPGWKTSDELIELLKKKGIEILDYRNLFDPDDSLYSISDGLHPSVNASKVVAEKMCSDLKIK